MGGSAPLTRSPVSHPRSLFLAPSHPAPLFSIAGNYGDIGGECVVGQHLEDHFVESKGFGMVMEQHAKWGYVGESAGSYLVRKPWGAHTHLSHSPSPPTLSPTPPHTSPRLPTLFHTGPQVRHHHPRLGRPAIGPPPPRHALRIHRRPRQGPPDLPGRGRALPGSSEDLREHWECARGFSGVEGEGGFEGAIGRDLTRSIRVSMVFKGPLITPSRASSSHSRSHSLSLPLTPSHSLSLPLVPHPHTHALTPSHSTSLSSSRQAECVSGCVCEARDLQGLWDDGTKFSMPWFTRFAVTASPECHIKVRGCQEEGGGNLFLPGATSCLRHLFPTCLILQSHAPSPSLPFPPRRSPS
jgi:hypothetical protein